MIDQNKSTYDSSEVIDHYLNSNFLQKPEEEIFNTLKPHLKQMKMLDIGVGTGRTTVYFADKVKEYKAIDYSEKMTEHCRIKFKDVLSNDTFSTADARDLSTFQDGYFDFILFSFNGIDNVSYEERLKVLIEIKRLLSPGGFFCFSTHNIQTIELWKKIQFSINPYALYQNILTHYKRKKINNISYQTFESIENLNHILVNDGAHNWKLKLSYIKPDHQINQLESIGFKNINIYNLTEGRKLAEGDIKTTKDKWLYYLCNT